MISRQQVLREIEDLARHAPGDNPFDTYRASKLRELKNITKRSTIVYAADFINPKFPTEAAHLQSLIMIGPKDKACFPDVIESVEANEIDFILESPGGMAEIAETLGESLRSKFSHIRVIIPGHGKERSHDACDGRRRDMARRHL